MKKVIVCFASLFAISFFANMSSVSASTVDSKNESLFNAQSQSEIDPASYTVAPEYIYYEAQFHTSLGLTPTKYYEWKQYGHTYRGYLTYKYTYPYISYYNYAGTLYRDDYNGGNIPIPSKLPVTEEK